MNQRKTISEIRRETAKHFTKAVNRAGLAELYSLEKKITRHYNAGTLSQADFRRLDVLIMEEIARFDCLV